MLNEVTIQDIEHIKNDIQALKNNFIVRTVYAKTINNILDKIDDLLELAANTQTIDTELKAIYDFAEAELAKENQPQEEPVIKKIELEKPIKLVTDGNPKRNNAKKHKGGTTSLS